MTQPMSTESGSGSEDHESAIADVLNGFALTSGLRRRKRGGRRDEPGEKDDNRGGPSSTEPEPADVVWPGQDDHDRSTTGEEQFVSAEAIPVEPVAEPPIPAEETGFVRPYAITGGRTKANYPLELETLISTRDAAVLPVPDQVEHQVIMEECRAPRSVAEIAAVLGVPLGVARVLISDAADTGLVTVHRTASGSENAEAHFMLMERVLSGLRRL
ncbi:uncharacterized protein DUF742 [Prauserella rugosa]|uniref:Uncharacterized protein DUF742 n=1 Tax=Prauserella rugosa TaxID=43354 RepID=A0A660C693_9PSEU|nr:uncharacterized protein DUF742 [Prauserella rugosa]